MEFLFRCCSCGSIIVPKRTVASGLYVVECESCESGVFMETEAEVSDTDHESRITEHPGQ